MERNGQEVAEIAVADLNTGPALMELRQDNSLSWMLMPILFERIEKFCAQYNAESDVELLRKAISEDFTSGDPRFHALMAMEKGKCVGYSLTILEVIGATLFANVVQLEVDDGTAITTEKRNEWLEAIADWARSKKCNWLHAYADNDQQERRLRMFYGFKPYKRLLRKEI